MIKLLIVDDSPVIREFLNFIFGLDPEIQVVGFANDGIEAIEKIKQLKPDVVTMDINMPRMNGLDATKEIMSTLPLPIVIVSGSRDAAELEYSFDSMEAGALAVLQRPAGLKHPDFETSSKELIRTVKAMSEIKVVRRWIRPSKSRANRNNEILNFKKQSANIKIIVIGASTGGPAVIHSILSGLPQKFSVPILIVQHMSEGFISGFVEWLNQSSSIPVNMAAQGELILPGNAYVAPDNTHMGINSNGQIILEKGEPKNGHCPSISYLFRTAADNFGNNAAGILLTGMGKDGAAELKMMKEKNALTIVQDEESSIVFGIPGEAVRIDAAAYILPPDKIVSLLSAIANYVDGSNTN